METVEEQIQRVGADKAPRITPAHIQDQIKAEYISTAAKLFDGAPVCAELGLLTICVLVLRNGFTVVGKSACASPENYNAEVGARIAREDAVQQVWALEGYHLRHQLAGTQYMGPRAHVG